MWVSVIVFALCVNVSVCFKTYTMWQSLLLPKTTKFTIYCYQYFKHRNIPKSGFLSYFNFTCLFLIRSCPRPFYNYNYNMIINFYLMRLDWRVFFYVHLNNICFIDSYYYVGTKSDLCFDVWLVNCFCSNCKWVKSLYIQCY